jgi:hypothetical protein
VGVFDELLGVDRLRLGNTLQFLFGLKNKKKVFLRTGGTD